jgi:hypothetical protein
VNFNDSLPLSYSRYFNNGTTYNLTDYISSNVVQSASFILASSGVVLKTLGANLNKWQQSREDKRNFEATNRVAMSNPSFKEYLYVNAEAITASLSTTFLSQSVSAWALYLTGNMFPSITYPPHGNQVHGAYYNGPVISTPFSIHLDLEPSNFTFPLPYFNLNVLLKKAVDVMGNATYGGGFFFKKKIEGVSQSPPAVTEAISTTAGVSAYLLSNFFARKHKEIYDARRIEDEKKSFHPVGILDT